MSSARLCFAGFLIAGGLILGAFALQGYFDPQWAQKQSHAATLQKRPASAKAINTFRNRSRFVASRATRRKPGIKRLDAPVNAAPAAKAAVKAADTREPAKRRPVRKKVAEKPKPPPQQAAFQWPLWNLFKN